MSMITLQREELERALGAIDFAVRHILHGDECGYRFEKPCDCLEKIVQKQAEQAISALRARSRVNE